MLTYDEVAQEIVKELKDIIGRNLNYINVKGEIIASTNPERVGSFHEGAYLAVKTKERIVVNVDGEYIGAKKGINFPVVFRNEVVGVIGISGEYEEIKKYGNIIKKMTEILIKEAYINEKLINEDEYQKIIVNDLIENRAIKSSVTMTSKEYFLIKKSENVVVIIIEYKDEKIKFLELKRKVFKVIKNNINEGEIFVNTEFLFIGILINRNFREVNEFLKEVENSSQVKLVFGVGSFKKDFEKLHESYNEALKALSWAKTVKINRKFYNCMSYGKLLYDISVEKKTEFLNGIFKNVTDEEIEEFKKIFYAYEKYNGSIKKISKVLFLHENTLQYQIKKFNEKTRLDLRNYADFSLLKLALLLY